MNKTFIALAAVAPVVITAQAEAAPQQQQTQVKKKKYKISQQTALNRCNLSVQTRYAHFARYCSMLKPETIARRNPTPAPVQVAAATAYPQDDSAATFFAADRERMLGIQVNYQTTQNVKIKSAKSKPAEKRPASTPDPIQVAKRWEGYHAHRNRSELRDLLSKGNDMTVDPARIPWCAAFANAVLKQTGLEGTGSLQARSFLGYGIATKYPKEGDIVVFTRGRNQHAGHVGFYMGHETLSNGVTYIKVLGGNQNREVNVAYYPANRLLGYRRLG
jgi:uncharacterized protein (TIGR02594 family)